MPAIATNDGTTSSHRDGHYSGLPNKLVRAANGVEYAYRDTGGGEGGVPLVLLQHFRGNLDNWDPALIDALASQRRVIAFDNAGVGKSNGATPNTVEQMAADAISFLDAMEFDRVDLLGFSIGSFVAQQIVLTRPASVRNLILASAAPKGATRHPRNQPRAVPRRLLRPILLKPAGRPGSFPAHVRPNRGPGHGNNLGDS